MRDDVPFSSSLRWSGLVTERGAWVLGAPDALASRLREPLPVGAVAERAGRGLRVLLLARAAGAGLRDGSGHPVLPPLEPVALVALADQLRPEVAESISRFRTEGVALKVLSGDDPRTVAALAVRAGLDIGEPVAGRDLDDLDDLALDRIVDTTAVFGRMAPEQKERVVASLRRQGYYVAMIGDGVNDARALKSAQVGVAMRSGSAVTRDVADIVLVDDSFAALLPAQREGRRIINGIATSMYVFLARVATQGLVILAVTMLGLGFPYSPTQVGLTLLTVGVPTLFLTFWARPHTPRRAPAGQSRAVRPARRAGDGRVRDGRVHVALQPGGARLQLRPHPRPGDRRVRELHRADLHRRRFHHRGRHHRRADRVVDLRQPRLVRADPVSLPAHPVLRRLDPSHRRPPSDAAGGRPARWRSPAVLFIPAFSDYFGLTAPAAPVFDAVLVALASWFVALTAALRLRLLDRVLGLNDLP